MIQMVRDIGSSFNAQGKRRTKNFNNEKSRLFYNEMQNIREVVNSNLQFATERFQDKEEQVNKIVQRLRKKMLAVCEFGLDCPMKLLQ